MKFSLNREWFLKILSQVSSISSLIASTKNGELIKPEFQRLSNILNFCDPLKIGTEINLIKSNTFERLEDPSLHMDDTPLLLPSPEPIKSGKENYGGLMAHSEAVQESITYLKLTFDSIITVIGSNIVQKRVSSTLNLPGLKFAALAINHRLRTSRLLVLLHLLNNDLTNGYLDSLDKVEAQNLLHSLQSIISNSSSVIDRFTYTTFEQVVYGIDAFHTVQKIKRILRETINLKAVHVCNHRNIGQLLDSYFQQHSQISFDLLMNALVLHYQINQQSLSSLSETLQELFEVQESKQFVAVQDFILLTDFISMSSLLLLLENGSQLRCKTEDTLLKNLQMPSISRYQLLKSYTKITVTFNQETILQRLISLHMLGVAGLKFMDHNCRLTFENTIDEDQVTQFLTMISDFDASSQRMASKKVTSMQVSSDQTQKEGTKKAGGINEQTMYQACKSLGRLQQYQKQRILELIEVESREKEIEGSIVIQVDSITSYKPVLHPSMVRFNEELYQEYEVEANLLQQAHAQRQNTLLSDIIRRIEKTNVQSEKLSILRKMQKQKEKKQILAERIEMDCGASPAKQPTTMMVSPSNIGSPNLALSQTSGVQQEQRNTQHLNQAIKKVTTMPILPSNMDQRKNQNAFQQSLNKKEAEDQTTKFQYAKSLPLNHARQPSTLIASPNYSALNQSAAMIQDPHPQIVIDSLSNEGQMQSRLITHIQQLKSVLLLSTEHLESLMLLADAYFSSERHRLIDSLRFHDEQIMEKEQSIRDMVSDIARSEMQRNIVTDELEDHTLRTIEVINISDIRIERENLEHETIELEKRQQELEKVESELLKEKEKLDEKKRKRRLVLNKQQNKLNAVTDEQQQQLNTQSTTR